MEDKSICDSTSCDGVKCSYHGEVACFVDPCGGCSAVFLDLDNNRVSLSILEGDFHKDFHEGQKRIKLGNNVVYLFLNKFGGRGGGGGGGGGEGGGGGGGGGHY